MASEKSEHGEDAGAAALAGEVKALRALLEELQAELQPAVRSTLRERSDELQRQGAELEEHREKAERLAQALEAVEARAAELEREATRWKEAAHRGLDQIAERARAQAALFEARTRELEGALDAIRSELAGSEARAAQAAARHAAEARSAAECLDASRAQVRTLEADVQERQGQHARMTRSLSWRSTAPFRWLAAGLIRMLKRGARLRRRVLDRR